MGRFSQRLRDAWQIKFRAIHVGRTCCIVGKGPSLDRIEELREQIKHCVFICLNDSVYKVEQMNLEGPLYAVQQDTRLAGKCTPKLPTTTHFVNRHIQRSRRIMLRPPPWSPNAVMYQPSDMRIAQSTLSAIVAIGISKLMGMNQFILVGFDSWKAEGKSLEYANCIGYSSAERWSPERFLEQSQRIQRELRGFPYEVIFPKEKVDEEECKGGQGAKEKAGVS